MHSCFGMRWHLSNYAKRSGSVAYSQSQMQSRKAISLPLQRSRGIADCNCMAALQVEEDVEYQSRRLNQYTCMAVWGGNNKLEPALGWFPESRDDPICYALNFC